MDLLTARSEMPKNLSIRVRVKRCGEAHEPMAAEAGLCPFVIVLGPQYWCNRTHKIVDLKRTAPPLDCPLRAYGIMVVHET